MPLEVGAVAPAVGFGFLVGFDEPGADVGVVTVGLAGSVGATLVLGAALATFDVATTEDAVGDPVVGAIVVQPIGTTTIESVSAPASRIPPPAK